VSVLEQADLAGLVEHLTPEVINNDRLTDDHGREMYRPPSADLIRPADPGRWESADTTCLGVEGPLTPLERLVIEVERMLTGPFREQNPDFGTDVKVLAVRRNREADVTLCVPVKAREVPTKAAYFAAKDKVRSVVGDIADSYAEHFDVDCHVNTKDDTGTAYLTAFGSSLDKGDQGAVGRGNGPLGVSSSERRGIAEAVAGKNPFHHPAKVYTEICRTALAEIAKDSKVPVRIAVTSRNGEPLVSPAVVVVQLDVAPATRPAFRTLVLDTVADCGDRLLAQLPEMSTDLALRDPVVQFRADGSRLLSAFG
jgi:S-adenosylmethionine synthetase